MTAQTSPAALVGPCLEKIHAAAVGRKYTKLRQDAQVRVPAQGGCSHALVGGRRDEGWAARRHANAGGAAALACTLCAPSPAPPPRPAQELMGKLDTLLAVQQVGGAAPARDPPPPVHPAPSADQEEDDSSVEVSMEAGADGGVKLTLSPSKLRPAAVPADAGHMPSVPPGGGGVRHADTARPGALADGAARQLTAFLRDVVETRKAPMLEVALDMIQRLVAFKLLQGPVYNINHR